MKNILHSWLVIHWPRKLVALVAAICVWFLVNQTITMTRTIPDVWVRITDLPSDKTIVGLLPNGLLNKRISITVTGKKSLVADLRPTDIEMVISADGHKESWIATLDKRNLVSVHHEGELRKKITDVSANDLYIKMSRLITEEIPVFIMQPIGDPPRGFQFLDVWPKQLKQTVSGPEEQVRALKEHGLEVTINLNRINEEELETLYSRQGGRDELSFKIPDAWKKVAIPFKDNAMEAINDPRAELLHIDFLKQVLIPLEREVPITVFFPMKYSATTNPENHPLQPNEIVAIKEGIPRLTLPLYVHEVSRLFLETIRDNLLLIIIAEPPLKGEPLDWTIECIHEQELEEAFVAASLRQVKERDAEGFSPGNEEAIRHRFRDYVRNLELYTADKKPLALTIRLDTHAITIEPDLPCVR